VKNKKNLKFSAKILRSLIDVHNGMISQASDFEFRTKIGIHRSVSCRVDKLP
jgi:hypothetical protein